MRVLPDASSADGPGAWSLRPGFFTASVSLRPLTRPVMKATLVEALNEREKIRRAGWMKCLGGLRRS